jgi:predicted SAM-dependent methyltransferase
MKLHIGGEQRKLDWKILNIQKKDNTDFVGDISDLKQFRDESIEEIYASHVLEHVKHSLLKKTFLEIYRVLKKGGKFYISVPDLAVLTNLFISAKGANERFTIMKMIFGVQVDEYDFHYFGWYEELLSEFLNISGFKTYAKVENFNIFNDTSLMKINNKLISLNVVAFKSDI